MPDAVWLSIWTVSVPLLIAALHRFIRRFLRRPVDMAERATLGFALASVALMAVLPAPYLLVASAVLHAIALGITFYLRSIFIRDRHYTTPGRFATLYLAMCLTAALALHDAAFLYLDPTPIGMQLGQFMPLVFMFITGWLVVVQLTTALARQEALAGRMKGRVIERTRALRRTALKLEQSERETLVAQERQPIMMDLHDGVGGHLVNVVATIRQTDAPDPDLRDMLEEAQTDLGLMVDSLHVKGDVVALLAALRARLEPILQRQGLCFDWHVDEAPRMTDAGPGANINLLRIVQEFVTNTLKHSGARQIRVETGPRHVALVNDGRGYDTAAPAPRGYGVASQRRRAKAIGASIRITSGDQGTALRLEWPG
ncbi:sensor histidine kinase [Roseovarius nanhaiticus]|uniref:sensor histidine kinase n=1 Tax=Roseovarius nanhaiticus TaxID=573024 RepID=UPI002491D3F0|nr:hypothetical protein [Roseovarius nanhaiticus]